MAIVRLWHGRVPSENGDEYEKFLVERAVPDYSSVKGLLKIYFTRRDDEDATHFLLVTIWESMDVIKNFAGEDPNRAKYYPEDDNFLLEKEKYVQHYEIFYEK